MEETRTCESCQYFRRHYIRVGNNHYMPLDEGHCIHPRLKDRKTEHPACQRFREKKGR